MSSKKKPKAKFHKDLDDLKIEINEFGEIKMNKSNEEMNEFLNENVEDKKLKEKEEKERKAKKKKE